MFKKIEQGFEVYKRDFFYGHLKGYYEIDELDNFFKFLKLNPRTLVIFKQQNSMLFAMEQVLGLSRKEVLEIKEKLGLTEDFYDKIISFLLQN